MNSTENIRTGFIVNKAIDSVLPCKTFNTAKPVFIDPFYQVTGYTSIEGPVSLAGKNVNTRLLHLGLDPRLRGDDELYIQCSCRYRHKPRIKISVVPAQAGAGNRPH